MNCKWVPSELIGECTNGIGSDRDYSSCIGRVQVLVGTAFDWLRS